MASVTPEQDALFISVVVPVYKCADCLDELCARLRATLEKAASGFEIILVDDRSPDNSKDTITRLVDTYPEVVGVRLSRNFGQHIAITAGLSIAKGTHAVVMDGDLQDPPELIPSLIEKLPGCELVMARRITRNHSWWRVLGSHLYFSLLSFLVGSKVDGSYASYSLISRKVIDAFLRFKEKDRHYMLILLWLGFEKATVNYEHQERHAGKSSYTLSALIAHSINGILFQNTSFLRLIVGLGLGFAALGFLLTLGVLYSYFVHGALPGWTSLVIVPLVSTGAILTCMGIIGLYVGQIFDEIKGRPLYVIDYTIGGKA
ncbi:glycosyltransferase [Verrucomicrobia bacterium LW23]|nr:glycosyltransferase [Verrucomicrobia bacterium LW23]